MRNVPGTKFSSAFIVCGRGAGRAIRGHQPVRNPRPPHHRHDKGHAPGKALAWREVDTIYVQARGDQGKLLPVIVLAGATLGVRHSRTWEGCLNAHTDLSVASPFEILEV